MLSARFSCLMLCCFFPASVLSHPHAWIDLEVRVLFDDSGRVTALEQSWHLDTMYSLVVSEQIEKEGVGDTLPEKYHHFGRQMLQQAAEFGYMTVLQRGGQDVPVAAARQVDLAQVDGRLRLSFVLPLAEPVDPKRAPLTYSVFDPTFYIEISHLDAAGVTLSMAPSSCAFTTTKPVPNDALRARALLVDTLDTVDTELGKHFAEHTTIQCGD